MPELQYIYWDACVILSFLNNEKDRAQIIEGILAKIKTNNKEKIATSVLSKVEISWVAHEKLDRILNDEEEEKIDKLWNDFSVLEVVEFNDEIALIARNIMRQGMVVGKKIRTNDAIHIATAKWIVAKEINTYNLSDFKKFEYIISIPIKEPSILQPRLI